MKRRKTTACRASVAAMLILALSVCGGASIGSVVSTGGGGSGTSPVSASVSIDTFSAQGTDDNTAVSKFGTTPGTAIIDGNQNNGLFSLSLSWNTTPSSGIPQQIAVPLSTSSAGTASDQPILQRSCNVSGGDCAGTSAVFQCRFDEANM